MAVNINRANVGYGLSNALQELAPQPIVAQRAPTTQDSALIGTVWCDQSVGQDVYILLQVTPTAATWSNVSAVAAGAITSIIGGVNINATGAAPIVTVNVDDAPTFIGLVTGNAGLTITAGSTSITSDAAAANAIVLDASDAAGGIDILTGGGEITIDSGPADGNIQFVPATATTATQTVVLNAKVGVAEYTNQTFGVPTVFTITNSEISATSSLIISVVDTTSVANGLTIISSQPTAGAIAVRIDSAGSFNAQDLRISFIVLN